jgi:hypothetical protein
MGITRSMIFRILLSIPVILTLFSGMVCCSNSGNNAAHGNNAMTVLTAVNGKVQVQKYGSPNWNDAAIGMTLLKGDKIKTDNVSTASITFFDGSIIELNGGTEISLDELISKSASSSNIIKIGQTIGETSSKIVKLIDSAAQYDVDTPSGVAAVRGSQMVVIVEADGTTSVYNVEGSISFTAQGQEVMIPVGQVSSAKPGAVPGAPQPGTPPSINISGATSNESGGSLTDILGRSASIPYWQCDVVETTALTAAPSANGTTTYHWWVKGNKEKIDITVQGKETIQLIDFDTLTDIEYSPAQNTATESKIDPSSQSTARDPNSILQYNPAVVGTETINGNLCEIIQYTNNGTTTKIWLWEAKGLALRTIMTSSQGSYTLDCKNYDFSAIPDSTFILPTNVKITG